ncbi:Acetyltransferase family protein [Giardia muris]|uniref:N-alpha-acetyltransferase 40 n=1 Tax=Giardia muris TaxID=5742 RepID=A0A4Z1TA23_GIAMU|nr:Acetyltransferase family protein [Giardia muris]|eukprot:TNJ30077.1 Acetyltransferase family protein [Giardia muris]
MGYTYVQLAFKRLRGLQGEHGPFRLFLSTALNTSIITKLVKLTTENMCEVHYEPITKTSVRRNIVHRYGFVLLAGTSSTDNSNEEVIGYAAFRAIKEYEERRLYIWELQVKEGYRSQGLGTQLLEVLTSLGRVAFTDVGVPNRFSLAVTCSQRNPSALCFYTQRGFINAPESDENQPYLILIKKVSSARKKDEKEGCQ